MRRVATKRIFLVRMRRYFLTLDRIDILCLVYSNFYTKTIIFKVHKHAFTDFKHYGFRVEI